MGKDTTKCVISDNIIKSGTNGYVYKEGFTENYFNELNNINI